MEVSSSFPYSSPVLFPFLFASIVPILFTYLVLFPRSVSLRGSISPCLLCMICLSVAFNGLIVNEMLINDSP